MKKIRLLLVVVTAVLVSGLAYFSKRSEVPMIQTYTYHHVVRTYGRVPLMPNFLYLVLAVLLTAALFMLFSTFFQVGRDEKGYYYNPQNFFWGLMSKVFPYGWGRTITLCKAYWLTAAFCAGLVVLGLITGFIGWFVYMLFTTPLHPQPLTAQEKELFVCLGLAVAGIVLLMLFVAWLAERYRVVERIIEMGSFVTAITIATFVIVILPISALSSGPKAMPLLLAVLIYLQWMAKYVGLSLCAIWAAYKYLPVLRKSAVGRFLHEVKADLCPLLEARTAQRV